VRTKVGYAGGKSVQPSYYNIGDHVETIEVDYDPAAISYSTLLSMFWSSHNPTVPHKRQYMSAIFYYSDDQRQLAAETMKEEQRRHNATILTNILPAGKFTEAENYHQKYLLRSYPLLFRLFGFDDRSLIDGHVAAKVNGYIGGYGSLEQFERDSAVWQLNEQQSTALRTVIARGGVHASCGL